ncbi:MAG: DUF255 domain-containing protein [Bacteroidetes bacterium]|nr:DUF255 domain-containing protein [Bacteroidota bacterium]
MKKIVFAFLALIYISNSSFKHEEGIKWLGFNEGYELAKKKNKIMIIDVYTDWCGWCKRMDRDSYSKEEIISIIKKDFVPVKFNPEIEGVKYVYNGKSYNGQELAGVLSNFQINGYPTTIFVYPKANKSEIVVGYKNAEQLKPILEDIKKRYYGKK